MLIAQWEILDADWPAVRDSNPLWAAGAGGSVAIDAERGLFLIGSSGRSKVGTGKSYVLWQDPYGPNHHRHDFKAFSNGEAVEHCRKFLEKHWK